MSAESLNAEELIVKAEIQSQLPAEEFSMGSIKENILSLMDLEGYRPLEPRKLLVNSRSMKFILKRREKEDGSFAKKLFSPLTPSDETEFMDYHEQLRSTRDDIPFEIEFRFTPFEEEESVQLRSEIIVTPAVVFHHEQVSRRDDYNVKNAVRSCKEFVRTISTEIGGIFLVEPHTLAETLEHTLDERVRSSLIDTEYGENVIKFCDQGDEALKYRLYLPALSAYIHAIEWGIITHLFEYADFDVLEKEDDASGLTYPQLVDLYKNHGDSYQTTLENLEKHKTDRRIMAHHKSGELMESHVHSVKDTLRKLLEESFR